MEGHQEKLKPSRYAEWMLQWTIFMALVTLLLAALSGCGSSIGRFDPPPQGFTNDPQHGALRPIRRATAMELVEAAKSGAIPDWFNEQERAAVERIRQ